MVLVKRICPPERRKATISVSASPSSPELSISKPADFQLGISFRIQSSTQPELPITISTKGTVFVKSAPDSTLDTIARGTVYLVSTSDPERRINLGNYRTNDLSGHGRASTKKRSPEDLLIIPAAGEVTISQPLDLERVFLYEQSLKLQDVVGEEWRLGLRQGYVGTTWWCWGDADGDLETGCNPAELVFEDLTLNAVFRFVS